MSIPVPNHPPLYHELERVDPATKGWVVWWHAPVDTTLSRPLAKRGEGPTVYPTKRTALHAAWNHWIEVTGQHLRKQAERMYDRQNSGHMVYRNDHEEWQERLSHFNADPIGYHDSLLEED